MPQQLLEPTHPDSPIVYQLPVWQRTAVPILLGPLRGARWLPASGGKLARLYTGRYEPKQSSLFAELIKPGDCVLDIGANVGYYTLLASRLVGSSGSVVAFEPHPKIAAFLRGHVAANRCPNVTVHELAIAGETGHAHFQFGTGTGTGKLSTDGEIRVSTISLDEFLATSPHQPTHLKIDVEGAEQQVLRGAVETLRRHRPTIFLSTHGKQVHAACCEQLQTLNYHLQPIKGTDLLTTREILCRPA